MARTGPFHHFGTLLLLAAFVLLLVTSISAPVINRLSILKVTGRSNVTFGSFGYCQLNHCTGSHIGYNPANELGDVSHTPFSSASRDTTRALTKVMILHPIACGIAFIAFLLAAGAGIIGSMLAALVAFVAWIITLVVMAVDFALFAIIKNHVNKDGTDSHAKYGPAMWTCLAAMICLFFGMIIVLSSCLSARKHRNDPPSKEGYVGRNPPLARKRFWQRRSS